MCHWRTSVTNCKCYYSLCSDRFPSVFTGKIFYPSDDGQFVDARNARQHHQPHHQWHGQPFPNPPPPPHSVPGQPPAFSLPFAGFPTAHSQQFRAASNHEQRGGHASEQQGRLAGDSAPGEKRRSYSDLKQSLGGRSSEESEDKPRAQFVPLQVSSVLCRVWLPALVSVVIITVLTRPRFIADSLEPCVIRVLMLSNCCRL